VRHCLGTALQGAQDIDIHRNLFHGPSITRSA
jgi:hypothetical protein